MRKNERLDIRLPESQKKELKRIARIRKKTISQIIREWIDQTSVVKETKSDQGSGSYSSTGYGISGM